MPREQHENFDKRCNTSWKRVVRLDAAAAHPELILQVLKLGLAGLLILGYLNNHINVGVIMRAQRLRIERLEWRDECILEYFVHMPALRDIE